MAKCHHESIVLLDDVHHDSFSVITHNSWPHTFPTTKMKNPRGKPLWRPLLFTILFLLITQTNATADSQPQMDSTQTGPSYTLNGLPGENPKLNRSLKLMDMVRQPTINHLSTYCPYGDFDHLTILCVFFSFRILRRSTSSPSCAVEFETKPKALCVSGWPGSKLHVRSRLYSCEWIGNHQVYQ